MAIRIKLKYSDVEKTNKLLFVTTIFNLQNNLDIILFWMRYILGDEQDEIFIISLKLDIKDLYSHYNTGQPSIEVGILSRLIELTSSLLQVI